MLRTVIGLVIGAHGIGHILFLVPLLGFADWGQSTRSWLLTGESSSRLIGSVLWIAVIVIYGMALFGLWSSQGWWRDATVIASIISIVGLFLFWISPPTAPVISATAFDIVVLISLLIVHFPGIDAIGA